MSAKETGYKWSKFVWDDWRNDASLQSCDLATKGLWMDLLSLMFSSERQGYLQANNKPMSLLYLSKKTGVDKRTIEKKLKVLIENNVCSVDENGIVFSRRMARETCKSPVSVQDTSSKNTVSVQEGSRKVPVNLQEKNAENSQKQEPLIIEQNRIDIEKKVSNPPCIPPSGEPAKKGSRLPDDWMPSPNDIVYAQNLNLDPEKVAEDFCDYWHAKVGEGARKTNWSLTWKRWCRRENEKNQDKQDRLDAYNRPRKSNLERIGEKIDRAAKHYDVDGWFENGVPQDYTQKPELKVIGGGRW